MSGMLPRAEFSERHGLIVLEMSCPSTENADKPGSGMPALIEKTKASGAPSLL
eukprot:CAMPEP_0115053822 /NCGR_PEP_ID=MMETSP0227-20121206/3739_1 /TAXON_ID=89957 /ORGANISM="Polarella glacialis, Strain CCMP 1383" /LENGTH=52 /DNA_ID=CAMNT_0002438203 /DNA_START=182 /DNA_END=343 /DNA_ORIENTATION=-